MVASPRGPHKLPNAIVLSSSHRVLLIKPGWCRGVVPKEAELSNNKDQRLRQYWVSSPSSLLTPAFLESGLLHESRPSVFHIMPRTHSPVNGYSVFPQMSVLRTSIAFMVSLSLLTKRQWLRMWNFGDGHVDLGDHWDDSSLTQTHSSVLLPYQPK